MTAVALTDTSNIHGCHELYKECKANGITPILGAEIYVESSLDNTMNHKLVLLAKSLHWYRNIISLISKSNLDYPGKLAKITLEDIQELNNSQTDKELDIVCLSWPISWEIPYYILAWKSDEEIVGRIKKYQEIFWEENYFLELIYHDDIAKQKLVTDTLIELSKNYSIPVVATNNCSYIDKEDRGNQDIIQALGTGHEIENPDRPTLMNGDYSFFTEEEMQILFGFLPEALENTVKIANMVDIEIETGGILIPKYELPELDQEVYDKALEIEKEEVWIQKLDSSEWYLRYISFKWMNWRFQYTFTEEEIFELIKKMDKPGLDKKLVETSPEELKSLSLTYYTGTKKEFLNTLSEKKKTYIERLEYELVVIHEMWFDGYFLIVADYINWARENNIPVWPGRWSAAGSLMAYLSWITDLDPLAYDLLFERFLNPARISMPDIDTDFADNERDLVVDYCRQKYGSDHVAQICTFGTFAARAAVKDVWRVMWVPFAEMNELVKLIPDKPGTKLGEALEDSNEFNEAYNGNKLYKKIIDNALKIEWNVRQLWVHACAVIIAPEPMTNFTALAHPPKDDTTIVTQYSAYPLEDLWLLKMDFLWLRNLTIIKKTQEIIKKHSGKEFDMLGLNMEDQKVFDIFSSGKTTWIFQFESDGMRKYLRDLEPNSFEDIIVMVSLYRPGPLQYIPTYIDRKHGKEKVEYAHPSLEKILAPTQWIAVYQEQIMQMVQAFAGFSLWEADILRRAIWKKKIDLLMEQKQKFTEAAKLQWHDEALALHIFEDVIEPFAGYWFNKSHAACYAFIAYQTAYLKAYYPTEFLTAIMVSDEENMDKIVMEVSECESNGISVLPPNVNHSFLDFTYIDEKNIRFWLKAIKWIWDGPINRIIETRKEIGWEFKDIEHFIESCGKEVINKKSLQALIMSWALDDLWKRKVLYEAIPDMILFCRKDEKQKQTSQIGLFDQSDEFEDKLELKDMDEFTFEEKLAGEKEMIGFYISWHPLDGLKRYCVRRSNNVKKLRMSMENLLEEDKKANPDKYASPLPSPAPEGEGNNEQPLSPQGGKVGIGGVKKKVERPKEEILQAVWVITDIRKIITKTWKTMMFLKCEWFDYDFEVVIFPKDIEKYADKLEVAKVIIINGALDINFEYGRKSLRAKDIKIASIWQVREQAQDLWLFDDGKRLLHLDVLVQDEPLPDEKEVSEPKKKEDEKFEEKLEEKILESKEEKPQKFLEKFVVDIPAIAKKEDLHDLKAFLQEQKTWSTKVFICLKGQEIDTKLKIESLEELEKWVRGKWG